GRGVSRFCKNLGAHPGAGQQEHRSEAQIVRLVYGDRQTRRAMALRSKDGKPLAETAVVAGRQAGVLENSRRNWWTASHRFFRWRATLQGSCRIFLVDRHLDLSGLRFDGNVAGAVLQLSEQSRLQLRYADTLRVDTNFRGWR